MYALNDRHPKTQCASDAKAQRLLTSRLTGPCLGVVRALRFLRAEEACSNGITTVMRILQRGIDCRNASRAVALMICLCHLHREFLRRNSALCDLT